MRTMISEAKFLLKTIEIWVYKSLSLCPAKAIPLPPASSCYPLVSTAGTIFQKDLLHKERDLLKTEKNVLCLCSQNHSLKICVPYFPECSNDTKELQSHRNHLSSSIWLVFISSDSKEVCLLLHLAQHTSRRNAFKTHVFVSIFFLFKHSIIYWFKLVVICFSITV